MKLKFKAKRKSKKKLVKKHFHLWDLPKSVFPRTRENKAKGYQQDAIHLFSDLAFVNTKLQHSAKIAEFCIGSRYRGKYTARPAELIEAVEDFVYHYENFCHRVYALREKIIRFVNQVIPIGYPADSVKISDLLINPIVRDSGLLKEIKKFEGKAPLSEIIQDRNQLTHRLYYHSQGLNHHLVPIAPEIELTPESLHAWQKRITQRANRAMRAMSDLGSINHGVSEKVVEYKLSGKGKSKAQ